MATEGISISIQLDDKDLKKQIFEIEKSFKQTGKTVGNSFGDGSTQEIEKLTNAIKSLNQNLINIGKQQKDIMSLDSSFQKLNDSINQNSQQLSKSANESSFFVSLLSNLTNVAIIAGSAFLIFGKQIQSFFADSILRASTSVLGLIDELLGVAVISGTTGTALGLLTGNFDTLSQALLSVSAGSAIAASALVFALSSIGSGIQSIGVVLSDFGEKTTKTFSEFEQSQSVLNKIIENFNILTNQAIGSTKDWSNTINALSQELNFAKTQLNSASTEIIQVGSRLGLTADQMQKLLKVSAEYAQINGKDVFETTVAIVSALNGNSQAVLNYGIKLTETSNSQFLFKTSVDQSFQSMSDAEKVQVRYNNLLSQYSGIAGVAAATAGTLANQNKRLENNINQLSVSYGEGASIVENFQIVNFFANKAVESLNETFIKTIGFIGSLTGLFFQALGVILKYGSLVYTAVRALQILNSVLASSTTQELLSKRFEILGDSVEGLVSKITKSNVKLNSIGRIFSALSSLFVFESKKIIFALTGISATSVTASQIFSAAIARIGTSLLIAAKAFGDFLLTIAPLVLKIGLIVGVIYVLIEVFKTIEDQTQIFSSAFNDLKNIFNGFINVASDVASAFSGPISFAMSSIIFLFERFIGILVFSVNSIIIFITNILNIGGALQTLFPSISQSIQKMENLNNQLIQSGFSLKQFGQIAQSSIGQASKSIESLNFEKLSEIRQRVEDLNIGKIGILSRELAAQTQEIGKAVAAGVMTSMDAAKQITTLSKEYWRQVKEIRKQGMSDVLNDLEEFKNMLVNFGLSETERVNIEETQRLSQAKSFFQQGLLNKIQYESAITKITQEAQRKRAEIIDAEQYTWKDAVSEIESTAQSASTIISGTFQRIGASLKLGGEAWSDFQGFIKNILGDILIQVGTAISGIGTAVDLLRISLTTLFGGFAIAGGLALIALGGLLKASSSSLVGAATAGASGAVSTGGFAPEIIPIEAPETELEKSRVTVNIQGSVMDSRDTGLRIVEILQEAFDTDGARVVTV